MDTSNNAQSAEQAHRNQASAATAEAPAASAEAEGTKAGTDERIAVICAGNRLMLDDGVGPAIYEELMARYRFPDNVDVYDVGCMSMDMLHMVSKYDFILSVDAVDGTGVEPGTVLRFSPDDIAGHGVMQSLHDLRLIDLLNAAELLGYQSEGLCVGVQVLNMHPVEVMEGLTPEVAAAVPMAADTVVAALMERGVPVYNADGTPFVPPTGAGADASEDAAPAGPEGKA